MHKIVENYILYESIGSGQYGKVFRAKNTKTNETVAVKSVPLEKFREVQKLEEFTANEIKTLNRIKCPNVIRFIEMLKTANNMYLVYEFCDGGTIEDILQKKHHLSEVESLKYFAQLVNAFKHIYRENILHRDLKPSNILLHNGVAKIADFGFCKKMNGPQELTFTMVGSPIYMAPEVLKGYPYNIKADIWSLGVVLYEMLYGVCPYEEKTLPALISLIDTRPLIFYPEVNKISPNTEELLRRMLTHDHRARIEWSELLEFPLNIEQLEKQTNTTSGPTINMAVVNYHDEQNTLKQQVEERITKIIKTLMKERNRVAFVSNVLHTMLELNVSNKTPVVGFMTLKRMIMLLETLKKDISIENSSSRFKSLERWNEYQSTDDFLAFSRYVNEEMEEAAAFLNIYKQELNVLVNSNPNDADLRDPSFKAERNNTALDMKYYHSALIQYAEDVKNAAQEKIKANDEVESSRLLIHAIEVLDCDNIDEFFEKNLGAPGLKLSDQPYFADVKNQAKEKQLDAINMKLNQARNRVV